MHHYEQNVFNVEELHLKRNKILNAIKSAVIVIIIIKIQNHYRCCNLLHELQLCEHSYFI